MNLSLIFLVLTAFLAYLLYDTFKKSRQQQELAQVQQMSSKKEAAQGRLQPSYQVECTLLKQLHEDRQNSVKHKQISIHLVEDAEV